MTLRTRSLFPVLVAFSLALPATCVGITFDTFRDPFPTSPDLPVTLARILWHGSWCDGVSCPPGLVVIHDDDFTNQGIAPGTFAGSRTVWLDGADGGQVVVRVDDLAGRLLISHENDRSSSVQLDYVRPGVPTGMSADCVVGGGTAFEIEVQGDFAPGKSLRLQVQVWSRQAEPTEGVGEVLLQVDASGVATIPFASFPPEVDFSDVDELSFVFATTGDLDLSIGALRTDGPPTPASARSWGRIKTLER